jgi:hypothetical protein
MAPKKKLTKVNTQLPTELWTQLKGYVDSQGTKVQTVFADAVRAFLATKDRR